jgi:hypothetical protein
MKKNYKKIAKMSNAIDPAAPASIWGKGCAGKGGATTNFDEALPVNEIRAKMYGRKDIENA